MSSNQHVSEPERINERSIPDDQLDTLRHMLGINDPSVRLPLPYRNYAAVNPGDQHCEYMERYGLVERYAAAGRGSDYDWYRCTEVGKIAAIRSHRRIRYSRSKRRYIMFLRIRDVCPDLTFREFLVSPEFAETRKNA